MARQSGTTFITGTHGNITFYRMGDRYYARLKSSLTSTRVKQDTRFERTMQLAGIFGIANKIASAVYKQLPKDKRGRAVRYELLRRARRMLAGGIVEPEIIAILMPVEDHVENGDMILKKVFKPGGKEGGYEQPSILMRDAVTEVRKQQLIKKEDVTRYRAARACPHVFYHIDWRNLWRRKNYETTNTVNYQIWI